MNSDGRFQSGSLRSSVSEDDETSVSSTGTATSTSTKQKYSYPPLPWEYGTNRCASQKGMSAFGSPRNAIMKVTSTRPAPNSSDGVVPKLSGGSNSFPNPATFQPFGDTRGVVMKTEEHQPTKPVNKAGLSRETDTFLSKWATPNPNATNAGIGKARGATTEVRGSGRRDKRCEGVLPKLQDTSALPNAGASFQNRRQVTTKVEGIDFSYDEEAKSKAALPWATGRSGMQTQAGTGGFLKPRDVCNKTYYDEKKPMSSYKFF